MNDVPKCKDLKQRHRLTALADALSPSLFTSTQIVYIYRGIWQSADEAAAAGGSIRAQFGGFAGSGALL